jgi:Undecaprenyl-phosphate glucose phosphotransferase
MTYAKAFFIYATAMKLFDAVTVFLVWRLSWWLRFETTWLPVPKGVPSMEKYVDASLPLVLVFSTVLHIVGTYRADRIPFGFRPLKKIVQGSVLGTLVFVSVLYFLQVFHVSRGFLTLFLSLVVGALALERLLLHGFWKALRPKIRRQRILLIGHGDLLGMYVGLIRAKRPYPIDWVGRLGPVEGGPEGVARLGDLGDLKNVLSRKDVDVVVMSFPPVEESRYAPLLQELSKELVDVKVVPDFGRDSTFTYHAEQECGVPLLAFNRAPMSMTDRFFKRTFDIVGSLALLLLFSPVMVVLAIVIKLTSKGPVLYSQTRIGANGRVFKFYKFRSMRVDAEVSSGPVWAKPGDDRTTPIGRWMRRTSLDELPQFFNSLRGDMSLVGPRPERPFFVEQFRDEIPRYMLRHKIKSGVTGWAQVNGWRGATSLEERIRHDLYYIAHWSHRFDIKILVLTLFRGFTDRNAY